MRGSNCEIKATKRCWHDARFDEENVDEHQGPPEVRQSPGEEAVEKRDTVGEPAWPNREDRPGDDPYDESQKEAVGDQLQSGWETISQVVHDTVVGVEGDSQVAMHELP